MKAALSPIREKLAATVHCSVAMIKKVEVELKAIGERLAHPNCRRLTLVGPSG